MGQVGRGACRVHFLSEGCTTILPRPSPGRWPRGVSHELALGLRGLSYVTRRGCISLCRVNHPCAAGAAVWPATIERMRREGILDGDLGGWPLWVEERADLDDLVGASLPSDWPMLSESLKRDLVSWNDDYLTRWPILSRRRRAREFAITARDLVARLQDELGDEYVVRPLAHAQS